MLELRTYQRDAVARVLNGISYLALDAGLGKTAISIAVAKELKARRVLIFCPATVRLVWKDELARWWPDSPTVHVVEGRLPALQEAAVLIINYDKVSQRNGAVDYVDELRRYAAEAPFDLMILDEAHALKNPKSNRAKAIFDDLLPLAKRVVALSGTPAPNHAGELYAPIRALAPHLLIRSSGAMMSQIGFENRYCEIEERRIGAGRTVRQIVGSQNVEELKGLLRTFMLRRTKKQVLKELPPLQFVQTPIIPSTSHIAQMGDISSLFSPDMSEDEFLAALRGSDEHVARLRLILGLSKVEPCGEYILSALAETKNKAVVWATHHAVIDALVDKLAALNPVKIDGRDDLRAREFAVARFLEDRSTRVVVANIKAASTGLTLVGPNFACSDAFFVEASYTPGDNYQAACRIHRIGQHDAVLAQMFVASGTIDARIMSILARKTNDLAALFEDGEIEK